MSTRFPLAAALLAAACLAPVPSLSHEALGTFLAKIERELREHPDNHLERSERAWLMLEHEMTGPPVGQDIDTLLSKPAWRETGLRLRALHLYLLGRHGEAERQAHGNIAAGVVGAEQYRLLAGVALARRDTAETFRAYRDGWKRLRMEEDYISMMRFSRAGGRVPDSVLREGLQAFPNSPGVHAAIFEACLENADAASLRRALELSGRGQSELWPRGADWKIRHARALLAAGDRAGAEIMLLRAMDLLEGEPRLRVDANEAVRLRGEIFGLLDAARAEGRETGKAGRGLPRP